MRLMRSADPRTRKKRKKTPMFGGSRPNQEQEQARQPSITSHYGHHKRRLVRSRSSPAIVHAPAEYSHSADERSSAHEDTRAQGIVGDTLASIFSRKKEVGERNRASEKGSSEERLRTSSACGDTLRSYIGSFLSYVHPPLLAVANEERVEESPIHETDEEKGDTEEDDHEAPEQPFSSDWLPPSPSINARTAFVDLHKEQLHLHYDHQDQPNPALGGPFSSIKTPTSTDREASLPYLDEQPERSRSKSLREASVNSGPFAHEELEDSTSSYDLKAYRPSKDSLQRFYSHMRKAHGKKKAEFGAKRWKNGSVRRKRSKDAAQTKSFRPCYSLRKCCKGLWTFLAGATVLIGLISLVLPVVMEVLDPEDVLVDQLLSYSWFHDVFNGESQLDREPGSSFSTGDGYARPGLRLAREGITKKHPVVFMPGISSTGLELWQGKSCMKNSFRERIWGDSMMLRKVILNELCWMEHMMLNETTGLDPNDIKVRAASGIRAADYIMGYYSLWGTIVKNLADLGYDESSIYMASYDWRLGPHHQEIRDRAWTRLKNAIEQLYSLNGEEKVVVIGHSLGTNYFLYFLQWVERQHMLELLSEGVSKEHIGRNTWTDKYVGSVMNIAGPLLGVPKGIPSLYSGEMRDTAEMGAIAQAVKEQIMPRRHVKALFQSYGSVPAMLPLGGDTIWGKTAIADEDDASIVSSRRLLNRTQAEDIQNNDDRKFCIAVSSRKHLTNMWSDRVAPDQVNGKGVYGHMMVLHHRMYGGRVAESDSSLLGSSRRRAQTTANMASKAAEMVLSGLRWSQKKDLSEDGGLRDDMNKTEAVEVDSTLKDSGSLERKESEEGSHVNIYGRGTASTDLETPSTVVTETSEGIIEYVVPDSTVDFVSMNASCIYKGNCTKEVYHPRYFLNGNSTSIPPDSLSFGSSKTNDSTQQCGTLLSSTGTNEVGNRSGRFPLGPTFSRSYLSLEDVYDLMREQQPNFMRRLSSFVNLTATRPPTVSEIMSMQTQRFERPTPCHTLECLSSAFVPKGYGKDEIVAGMAPHQYWSNPLAVPLPYAPSMKIISLYGVGSIAERAFHFESILAPTSSAQEEMDEDTQANKIVDCLKKKSGCVDEGQSWRQMPVRLATNVNSEEGDVVNGVQRSEGDVTVPVLSLGFMPSRGWNSTLRNPSGIKMVQREFTEAYEEDHSTGFERAAGDGSTNGEHSQESVKETAEIISGHLASVVQHSLSRKRSDPTFPLSDQKNLFTALKEATESIRSAGMFRACLDWMRSNSNDHVDIILNAGVLEDVLLVAAGEDSNLQNRKLSAIDVISAGVDIDE